MREFVPIKEDENGEAFIEIPESIREALNINKNTLLSIKAENGYITITKKTMWTPEELQEGDNLEMVVDDVSTNGVTHYVIDGDNKFVIVPYDDHMKTIMEGNENGS